MNRTKDTRNSRETVVREPPPPGIVKVSQNSKSEENGHFELRMQSVSLSSSLCKEWGEFKDNPYFSIFYHWHRQKKNFCWKFE